MASVNRVFLMGNLTADPDLRYTPGGTAVASFRLACNRKYKAGDDLREDVLFIGIVGFGKMAEAAKEYLQKGSPVFVEGRLQSREYERRDGGKTTVIEVVANSIQFLGAGRGRPTQGQGPREPGDETAGDVAVPGPSDDEVPF